MQSHALRPKIGKPPALQSSRSSWRRAPRRDRQYAIMLGSAAAGAVGLFFAFLAAQHNEGVLSSKHELATLAPAAGDAPAGVSIESHEGEQLSGSMVVVKSADDPIHSAPVHELSADDKKRLLEIISRH